MTGGSSGERLFGLDFLRGLAVMGILLLNIVQFGLPEIAFFGPDIMPGSDLADRIAWTLTFIFAEGKMRGIFTLLFGASMMLIIDRAEASGKDPASIHFRRLFWLAIFGLLHSYLLWFGDILFTYAVYGALAYFARDWDAGKLIRMALLLYLCGFVFFCGVWGSILFQQFAAFAPEATDLARAEHASLIAGFGTDSMSLAQEVAIFQSDLATILHWKWTTQWNWPFEITAWTFFETLPLILLGMAFYKNGFLTGQWPFERYCQYGATLTFAGLLIAAALATLGWVHNFDIIWMMNIISAWSIPALLLTAVGYIALINAILLRILPGALAQRIAAAGRTAFTNYLGTSIVMCGLFYGWGLGWFGTLGRAELYLVVLPMWAIMLLWPQPWLAHFRYGPFEWLWRSLAKPRIAPIY